MPFSLRSRAGQDSADFIAQFLVLSVHGLLKDGIHQCLIGKYTIATLDTDQNIAPFKDDLFQNRRFSMKRGTLVALSAAGEFLRGGRHKNEWPGGPFVEHDVRLVDTPKEFPHSPARTSIYRPF